MMTSIVQFGIAAVATYYYAAIMQAVTHRVFGHKNRVHAIYETHARGHHARYVPGRLLTDRWVDSERHVMWYFALPFIPVAAVVAWLSTTALFVGHLSGLLFAIGWHIYLHKQYHLRGSAWRRFGWFRKKRSLHFAHHRKVRSNYAIVEYWIDRLMRTYVER